MFKILKINKLIVLTLGVVLVLLACNGGKTKRDALNESISKFKDSIEPIEIVEYIPKEYSEVVTDTILSNGFIVKIKSFTNMNESVLYTFTSNTENSNHYFRKIDSEIIVYKNEKEIFSEVFNKEFLLRHFPDIDNLEDFITSEIYIDQLESIQTNKLVLIASQCIPTQNDTCPIYKIVIDAVGQYNTSKIYNHART